MINVDLEEPTSFLDHVYMGCIQRECKPNEIIIEEYRVFRHIGCVYTIIGAFCQETQARATSPNGCKPLQADKWPRLQRGATKCVFMTQIAAISKFLWSLHPSFVLRTFSCNSQSFPGDFTVFGHLTCSSPYLEAHGTNLCVPWCCTSRFCMSWRGGVKQKLGGLNN